MSHPAYSISAILHDACLLPAMTRVGLVFCPFDDVALVMEEVEGRLTIVTSDRSVVHCPGPLSAVKIPGLVPLATGILAAPRWGRARGDTLVFPAGWTFPRTKLPRPTPALKGRSVMVKVGTHEVDLTRLRRMAQKETAAEVELDDGTVLAVAHNSAEKLARVLGLPSSTHLEPLSETHRAMYRLGLRDFPYVLLQAPAAELRRVFGDDARLCIANLIWEAARHRARGTPLDYGTEYRGFYYRPIIPVLNRLGIRLSLTDLEATDRPLDTLLDAIDEEMDDLFGGYNDPQFSLYGRILSDMVGDARLITLRSLGFIEARPDLRTLGTVNAQWLIVVEKASLEGEARRLAGEFGASSVILGGMAKWEAAEPTADMLRPILGGRSVKVVTYGDYDPAGWEIDDAFVNMLARYEIHAEIAGRLIRPQRFTAEEIKLVAEALPTTGSAGVISARWMKKTHGIHGKPLGLHADHLVPYERVRKAFIEETGLVPL